MTKRLTEDTVNTASTHLDSVTVLFEELQNFVPRIAKQTAPMAASDYVHIKNLADRYTEIGKILGDTVDTLKRESLPNAFERDKLTSFNTSDGFRVTISQSVRCAIINKVVAYDWLRNNGLGAIISETVNSSTLSATARSLLDEGKELPPEIFNTHLQPSTSVTKLKAKA